MPHLDRMDRELKVEQLKRSLYVLYETMVARCARSSVEYSVCPLSRGSTVKSDSFYSFQFNEMARPERFELPTLCFEGSQGKNLNACSGVAYEHSDAF